MWDIDITMLFLQLQEIFPLSDIFVDIYPGNLGFIYRDKVTAYLESEP